MLVRCVDYRDVLKDLDGDRRNPQTKKLLEKLPIFTHDHFNFLMEVLPILRKFNEETLMVILKIILKIL
jgi:hypothetical protein